MNDNEPKRPRFGGNDGRRRGGKAGGPRKARPPEVARAAQQVRWARARAREAAHEELVNVAREVGSFMDDLQELLAKARQLGSFADALRLDAGLAERGRELSDRLYTAVSSARGR